MSDDEYVYDSPYEDVYDLFDDADPAPELADDLAERAVYSPIWQHTHTGELKDYFSDWDDHSDDYWDDDPKLLNDGDHKGRSIKVNKADAQKSTKRGRKRKLSEAREKTVTIVKNVEALQATLRGTVWKRKSPVLVNDYTKGLDKPTALRLSDSIMRSAYNKTQGFGKGALKRDESWANNLSLADMGLTKEAASSSHHNGEMDEDEDEDEDGGQDEEKDGLDPDPNPGKDDLDPEECTLEDSTSKPAARTLAKRKHSRVLETLVSPELQTIVGGPTEEQASRKRRRVVYVAEGSKQQGLPSPEVSMIPEISDKSLDADESMTLKSHKRRRKSPEGKNKSFASRDSVIQDEQEQKLPYNSHGRKRKLSPESSASGSAVRTRAKRNAAGTVSK